MVQACVSLGKFKVNKKANVGGPEKENICVLYSEVPNSRGSESLVKYNKRGVRRN